MRGKWQMKSVARWWLFASHDGCDIRTSSDSKRVARPCPALWLCLCSSGKVVCIVFVPRFDAEPPIAQARRSKSLVKHEDRHNPWTIKLGRISALMPRRTQDKPYKANTRPHKKDVDGPKHDERHHSG